MSTRKDRKRRHRARQEQRRDTSPGWLARAAFTADGKPRTEAETAWRVEGLLPSESWFVLSSVGFSSGPALTVEERLVNLARRMSRERNDGPPPICGYCGHPVGTSPGCPSCGGLWRP